MSINPVNSSNKSFKPSFGHTFKVSICVKDPNSNEYKFVSPCNDKKLYKELNSKVIGWLNEGYITNLRKEFGKPRKKQKYQSDNDKWNQKYLTRCLYNIDSDYRKFNTVRSVYNRYGLTYFATGIDVPVIENMKGAKQIGIAKSEALLDYGITHTPEVEAVVDAFKRNSIRYAKNKYNLLRSKNGKEIMLKLDFGAPRRNVRGKTVYDLENINFHEIKKSKPLSEEEKDVAQAQKMALWNNLSQSIKSQVAKFAEQRHDDKDFDKILSPFSETQVPQKPKRTRKQKKDPRQLELFG